MGTITRLKQSRNGVASEDVQFTYCWCGCGETVREGSEFAQGHDVKAVLAAVVVDWGNIKNFIDALGYGPNEGDYSLQVTYFEHMAKKIKAKARPRRPKWMAK